MKAQATKSLNPARIYVFRIGQFGDTVVSLPAIQRIAELNPGIPLTLVTNAPAKNSYVTAWDVLEHTSLFSGVLFYSLHNTASLRALVEHCRQQEGRSILYYLPPRRSWSQKLRDWTFFRFVCGINQIVGLDWAAGPSLRDSSGALTVLPPEWQRMLDAVDPTRVRPSGPFLAIPEEVERRTSALLAGFVGRKLIALGPGSKMPAKKWFADRYLLLARELVARFPDAAIVVFGGREDKDEGEKIVHALAPGRALNLAGVTNIVESAAALRKCQLYVGNDTGTMHMAAVMGVSCVAIFTARDNRDSWIPWGEIHEILRRDVPCAGCMLEDCIEHRMRCLDLISVNDVLNAASKHLTRVQAAAYPRER